jgi:hypothetical protein
MLFVSYYLIFKKLKLKIPVVKRRFRKNCQVSLSDVKNRCSTFKGLPFAMISPQ